ncbi:MAG: hypothetical protein WA624_01005 [Methylocella sp.]
MPGIETNDFEPEIADTSHGVIAPVSIPIRASSPACRRTKALICSGTDGHWPRHSPRPESSTTQTVVIFCETSKPTKWVIDQPPILRITGRYRPDRDTIGGSRADRDYRMSTYDKAEKPTDRILELAARSDDILTPENESLNFTIICCSPTPALSPHSTTAATT